MRSIWLLTLTEEGDRLTPAFEVNYSFVVVAGNPSAARGFAEAARIDEPSGTWTTPRYSKCSKVGVCTNVRTPTGVLVSENNAS